MDEAPIGIIPDLKRVVGLEGFSLLEHTMDNGRALGVKFMYRDKFVEEGMADREYVPGYDYHGLSVICYYGNPEARLGNQYVFTIEKDNAINTPTAYELAANPKLMTPEWEAYLKREGRKNADGSYELKNLTPDFSDPFSLSFLMVRINKKSPHGLEIISRYNHGAFTSGNKFARIEGQPNATLDLNLDNLVEGLTKSLYAHKNIEINEDKIRLSPNIRIASDNKLYQIKYERNGYYFGKGFYIDLTNKAHVINPAEEILVGQVLINKNGAIDVAFNKHCFKDAHKIIISGNKVIIKHEGEEVIEKKEITLPNGTTKIVEKKVYKNEFTTEISVENNEVYFNSDVDKIDSLLNDTINIMMINILSLPNVTTIENGFLHNNNSLKTIDLPNVTTIENYFYTITIA